MRFEVLSSYQDCGISSLLHNSWSYLFPVEQELLEKEIGRLRALYQQQQLQQQPSATHKRASSKDLDSQFSSLSLNSKDSNSSRDSVSVTSQFHF